MLIAYRITIIDFHLVNLSGAIVVHIFDQCFETLPRVARSSLDKMDRLFLLQRFVLPRWFPKLGTALNGAINVSPSITKLTASDLYKSIIPNLNPRSSISLANSSTVS